MKWRVTLIWLSACVAVSLWQAMGVMQEYGNQNPQRFLLWMGIFTMFPPFVLGLFGVVSAWLLRCLGQDEMARSLCSAALAVGCVIATGFALFAGVFAEMVLTG